MSRNIIFVLEELLGTLFSILSLQSGDNEEFS
jgi:hypothetical protein